MASQETYIQAHPDTQWPSKAWDKLKVKQKCEKVGRYFLFNAPITCNPSKHPGPRNSCKFDFYLSTDPVDACAAGTIFYQITFTSSRPDK